MKLNKIFLAFAAIGLLLGCEESSIDDVGPAEDVPTVPINGYNSSDEIAIENSLVKLSFEENLTDERGNLTGGSFHSGPSYGNGAKGKAYYGQSDNFAVFNDSGVVPELTSFTYAMWIKTSPHTGGAQSVFMLPKTSDFWGNSFLLIEGTDTDRMHIKFYFSKAGAPWSGQWVELSGDNRLNNMYESWKHISFTYDENTSKFQLYVNGARIALNESFTNRFQEEGVPLGALNFTDASKFIIGGYQQHIGEPWGAPDGWMLNYTGGLDEFRIYNTALTASQVESLYILENDNR